MKNRDFKIGDKEFKLSKIDPFKQFHIVRRIAPILSDVIPILSQIKQVKDDQMSELDKLAEFGRLASPLMVGISKLSDEDSDKVLKGLLGAVEIKQEQGNWARIVQDSQIMFSNLDLPILLAAAGHSFMFNMSGFFDVLPQVSPGGK